MVLQTIALKCSSNVGFIETIGGSSVTFVPTDVLKQTLLIIDVLVNSHIFFTFSWHCLFCVLSAFYYSFYQFKRV